MPAETDKPKAQASGCFDAVVTAAVILVIGILGSVYVFGYWRTDMHKKGIAYEVFTLTSPVRKYYEKFGTFPESLTQVGIEPNHERKFSNFRMSWRYSLSNNALVATIDGLSDEGPVTLILRPTGSPPNVIWDNCGGTIDNAYRATVC